MRQLPLKEREPFLHVGRGTVDVQDSAVVLTDVTGVRMQIPVGTLGALMLEPGASITHAAVKVCAEEDCLLVWCGEGGVRLYSAGTAGGARSDKLLFQFRAAHEPALRLRVVREMYRRRFGEAAPDRRSIEQLRGLEGVRVREMYGVLAEKFKVRWQGRKYDPKRWNDADPINRALSAANACMYAVTEAAILVAGYSPAVGFVHSGKPLAFVYDIADLFKFEVSVPVAFETVAAGPLDVERRVRKRLRDQFRKERVMQRIVPMIEEVLDVAD